MTMQGSLKISRSRDVDDFLRMATGTNDTVVHSHQVLCIKAGVIEIVQQQDDRSALCVELGQKITQLKLMGNVERWWLIQKQDHRDRSATRFQREAAKALKSTPTKPNHLKDRGARQWERY